MDFRKNSLFGIIFLPYWGMSNWRFFLSCIMGYGWMGNISLRIILFYVLAKYKLIGWIWTFQFIQDHPLGLASRTFALGWYGGAWVLHGAHHSFGLGEWDIGSISLPPSNI